MPAPCAACSTPACLHPLQVDALGSNGLAHLDAITSGREWLVQMGRLEATFTQSSVARTEIQSNTTNHQVTNFLHVETSSILNGFSPLAQRINGKLAGTKRNEESGRKLPHTYRYHLGTHLPRRRKKDHTVLWSAPGPFSPCAGPFSPLASGPVIKY